MTSLTCLRTVGVSPRPARTHCRLRVAPRRGAACRIPLVASAAAGDADGPYFEGEFGRWQITQADKLEVWSYRVSLSVVAAAFAAGTAAAIAPDADWAAPLLANGNLLAAAGGGGTAVAVTLIHIYVTPLKRFLQVLLGTGAAGAAWLAVQHPDVQLPAYVAEHPGAIWLVGPAFAALAGICFKEGFCYGKKESWALAVLLPTTLLLHLTGLMPAAGDKGLSVAVAVLLALFAARKYTQPVKEDIGDKSVFEFYAMDEAGQRARLEQLRLELCAYDADEPTERFKLDELNRELENL